MSEEDKLNQETGGEQEPETSPTTPEKSIINQTGSLETEKEKDEKKRTLNQNQQKRRPKSGAKGKLVRSHAVCEEPHTFGEEYPDNQDLSNLQLSSSINLQGNIIPQEDSEKEKDRSKQKKPKAKAKIKNECSQEYTDSTGIDLHEFLSNTLKNNHRDRMILLKVEQEIIDFINDNNNLYKKFPQMSSYQRMLVHRVAAYFGMDHNVDQTGKSVIINKTASTRIPEQRFCEHLKDEKCEESQKRFILKRDNSSIDTEDNQQNRIHPFREDRRSKSIEEREEEYQRARERIFAQDSVCSQENFFMEIRIADSTSICNDIQKKRQLFRCNRNGSGNASGSRQSSTENDLKWADQRPWSSTDSDSSNRNLKPAIKKTASFGGIPVLTRGDSSGGSTIKLSKAGSESSSSAGSSGSLSRMHQPLQNTSVVPGTSVSTTGSIAFPENGVAPSNTSYVLLPLEATGIPPGSLLLNPHTGQPFVNPDGTPAIYNPPNIQQVLRPQILGQTPEQISHQQQTQQQVQGHLPTQTVQAMQTSPQTVQCPIVSYPPAPQHLVPVSATQQFSVRDDITTPFNQLNLSRQSSDETSEPSSGPIFPPGVLAQPLQQQSFMLAHSGQSILPGSLNQSATQVLQSQSPQGYVQQTPAQMPVYYYPSGQYPTSANHQYRSIASVQHNTPQILQNLHQEGPQSALSNQQQGFQGLVGIQQPPQSKNRMNNQQGSQVHGMMAQYPSMSSYQLPVSSMSQGMPQQAYQQQIMLPNMSSQAPLSTSGIPVYCNVIPPSPQNNLRLITPHCPNNNMPVISANCRTNCSATSNTGWQIRY